MGSPLESTLKYLPPTPQQTKKQYTKKKEIHVGEKERGGGGHLSLFSLLFSLFIIHIFKQKRERDATLSLAEMSAPREMRSSHVSE